MSSKRKRKRRTFSEEFKRDAVNLVVVEGIKVSQGIKVSSQGIKVPRE